MASPQEPARPQGSDRDLAIVLERDRIAAELQQEVIQRIFAIGVSLESAAAIAEDRLVRRRVEQAISDIDDVVRVIRDTVFDRKGHPSKGRGLAAGIVQLCGRLSPVPAISFQGAVNGAPRSGAAELLDVLGDALVVIGKHWAPVRVDVSARDGRYAAVIHAVPLPGPAGEGELDHELASLRARAAQAGIWVEIEPGRAGTRFAWHAS